MSEIQTNTFLESNSGALAGKHALRICCFSHAVLPSDKEMKQLIEQEIISELLELAFHGRRTMERYNIKQATIGDDPLWPASQVSRADANLFDAFGVIIHSRDLSVNWENLEKYEQDGCNPYKGRVPIFAGSITAVSDKDETEKLPLGAIVGAYIHFQNQIGND